MIRNDTDTITLITDEGQSITITPTPNWGQNDYTYTIEGWNVNPETWSSEPIWGRVNNTPTTPSDNNNVYPYNAIVNYLEQYQNTVDEELARGIADDYNIAYNTVVELWCFGYGWDRDASHFMDRYWAMNDMLDHPFFSALKLEISWDDTRQINAYVPIKLNKNLDLEIEDTTTYYWVSFELDIDAPTEVADNVSENRAEFLRFMIDLELRAQRLKKHMEEILNESSLSNSRESIAREGMYYFNKLYLLLYYNGITRKA